MTIHSRANVAHVRPADTQEQAKRAATLPIEGCEALMSAQVAISETAVILERHRSLLRGIARVCVSLDKEMAERISHLTSDTLPEVRHAASRFDLHAQTSNRRRFA